MEAFNKICTLLDRACKVLLVAIFIVITFSAFMQVFSRNLMGGSLKWTDELCRFCLVWLAFISAALGVRTGAHLAIDVIVSCLPKKLKRIFSACSLSLICIFSLILIFQGAILSSHTINQLSTVLTLRMGLVYGAIPVSGFFMLIFAAAELANMLSSSNSDSR
jgi:TRAP-type C4-dicarboxylate transport system permease small subunit